MCVFMCVYVCGRTCGRSMVSVDVSTLPSGDDDDSRSGGNDD